MTNHFKNDKNKIMSIIVIFIICIITSFLLIFKNMNIKEQEVTKTETEQNIQSIIDQSISDEDKSVLSLEEQMSLAMGDFMNKYENSLKIGDETNKECPKEESNVLYKNLIKKAESADYNAILNEIEEKAKHYKFHEEYNWKIGNLYYDATLMIATLDAPVENRGQMVKNMKDPVMFMIGTLLLPEESRRSVILDKESLSPIFDGSVIIKKHQEVEVKEDEEFEDSFMDIILTETFSVNKIHKFYFEVEQNPLISYVVEHEDGTLEFYTIKQDGNYVCHYKTISYWLKLDSSLN